MIAYPHALRRLVSVSLSSIAMLLSIFALIAQPAMAQVVPGVLQSAAQTATITGSVTQSDGTPVAGATVYLTGPGAHLATVSDGHGAFVFTSVPYGTYRIDASALSLGTASRDNVIVKGDITLAIQYVARTTGGLKEIARVSTHSAGASINVTPASIASVNPTDYAFQGNTSWRELLNQIPGVTVGGDLSQGRAGSDSIPNSPIFPIVLSINGAQPYETSVTLDGMPIQSQSLNTTAGSGTDLSYLPMSTFDTADVVRGPGADAPSILNSIGGSFVLHAPGPVEKNAYEFSVSNDAYGGTVANAKVALRFGRLSAMIVYGVDNSPGPLGSAGIAPLEAYGFVFGTVNGQAFCAPYNLMFNPARNYTTPLLARGSSGSLHSAWSQHNGALALSYNINPSVTAEVFYAGTSTVEDADDALRPFNFIPGASYSGSIAPGVYNTDQTGTIPSSQSARLLEEKITAYVGGGVLRVAALQNTSFDQFSTDNSLINGQYTLYGTGYYASAPSTPITFNGTSAYLTTNCPETFNSASWSNNRDLLMSFAKQVGSKASFGASYVTSYYNDPQTVSIFEPGCFFYSASPISAISETTNELRLQGSAQISDKFSLDASWYFARGTYHVPNPYVSYESVTCCPAGVFTDIVSQPSAYEDSVFSYSAPRLGATWRASRDVVIRAAAGGGFALPQLSYLVGSSGVPTCNSTYCSVSLTNLNLQPEKSFGFDLGTDMRLYHDTALSFDIYRTNLYGQFFTSASTTGTCPTCAGKPLYTTEKGNLSQSRMEGINIGIHHDVPRGMYWSGELGLTRGYVVSVPAGFYNKAGGVCTPATPSRCQNQYIVPGINFDGYFQSSVPYANGTATIGYRWSPEKYVDLSPTYFGNNNPYYRPAFLELDAHARYPLTNNVSLLATFENITGIYGQSQQVNFTCPCLTAPVIAGAPQETYGLYGMPYGPRALIVTINVR